MQLLIGKGLFSMSCFMLSDVTCELIVGYGPRMVDIDGIKEVFFVDGRFFPAHGGVCRVDRWYSGRFLFPCCLPHIFIFQKFGIVVCGRREQSEGKDSQQGQSELREPHATKLSRQVLYKPRNQHLKNNTR